MPAISAEMNAPIISLALGASISPSNIKEGSDVYLECNIRANPWVSDVTWQFEDHYVVSNKSAGIIISNQTLVLQSVRREHRGRYRCLAGNSEGQSVSDYLHLLVQYAPVCKLSDPKVYGVARTEVVNVTCEVEADPPDVNFRWALNNTLEVVNLQKWWSEGSRSVLSYTPRTLAGYGLLLCWGNNVIGGQREPCVAKIIPADSAVQDESIRCETPLKKELEDSQEDRKGPDIIPFANETEVYFTGSASEQMRQIRSIHKLAGSPTELCQRTTDTRL
ncbi:Lachesin like protein [Argiope bruennichi]|uniref:Lachesin like protein n=1 Tax=Argiope bruennichi TaxID=94029 RepID=A0A8T0EID6_ARGBR|nr:Lachesin like protein [Argiope bruennichi]